MNAKLDGLGSSIEPGSRGASGGKGLPPRVHAIHKILFFAQAPLELSEIEQQLLSWGYERKTADQTRNHLRTMCEGLRNCIVSAIEVGRGKYSLTTRGRELLAKGHFSDILTLVSDLSPLDPRTDSSLADLTADTADQIQVADDKEAGDSQTGAGFGNTIENKAVELASVRAVRQTYERDGWSVRSVERDKCGFDLVCSKNGLVENLEVKGVKGGIPCFFITANEVNAARTNANFFLLVVTSALSTSPKITKYTGKEFIRRFDLSAIQYRATLKS